MSIMTPEMALLASVMWSEGEPVSAIADELGLEPKYVRDWAWRHRDSFPARRERLTAHDVETIHVMRICGASFAEIARRVGCSGATVSRVVRRNRW